MDHRTAIKREVAETAESSFLVSQRWLQVLAKAQKKWLEVLLPLSRSSVIHVAPLLLKILQ